MTRSLLPKIGIAVHFWTWATDLSCRVWCRADDFRIRFGWGTRLAERLWRVHGWCGYRLMRAIDPETNWGYGEDGLYVREGPKSPDHRPLRRLALLLAAFALAVALTLLAGGCAFDPAAQAKGQATAVHRAADAVGAEADAADADLADAETGTASIAQSPDATPAIQSTATAATGKIQGGRKHVQAIRRQVPALHKGADDLQTTVSRAVDANLAPYRSLAFWTVLLTAIAVGVFWWTEKPRYAVAALAVGGTVYAFARLAGWEQQHPYALPALIGVGVAAVVALEWVRHPESIKSILAGFRAGGIPNTPTPTGKAV